MDTPSNFSSTINFAIRLVEAAGWTPCPASSFTDPDTGNAFAFSTESASGRSDSGPAFEVVLSPTLAILRVTGRTRTNA